MVAIFVRSVAGCDVKRDCQNISLHFIRKQNVHKNKNNI